MFTTAARYVKHLAPNIKELRFHIYDIFFWYAFVIQTKQLISINFINFNNILII